MTRIPKIPPYDAAGYPTPRGLYDPANEHDACGMGFVARLDGVPRHSVVTDGIQVLANLEHRGAVGGDASTGDGAGVMVRMPDGFLRDELKATGIELPKPGDYAAGMFFLPTDETAQARCKDAVAGIVNDEGLETIAWRAVPTDPSCLGDMALTSMPSVHQLLVARGKIRAEDFERKLYVCRRRAEKEIGAFTDGDYAQFYVPSFSARKLVYKGLLSAGQVQQFYKDLQQENFETALAMVHQRFSTNTFPTWPLAQPFRFLAHNGEINTLRGNINQMKAREVHFESPLFGDDIEKVRPILNEKGSDSAILDNALELLVHGGRSLAHAMMMLVPEAWGSRYHMSQDRRAFYEFHANMMEPWDGPAALVVCDGRYIGGTLDRNGLRPSRYTMYKDGTIVLSSETGVLDYPTDRIVKRGRLRAGNLFLVDMDQHRIVPDQEIKAKISRAKPYRKWLAENRISLRGLLTPSRIPSIADAELLRRQHIFGYTEEELKMLIAPMAAKGQEAVGSMGNDAALAVLSDRPHLLFAYFKQLFAQVTNPAIDPLREELVMSLLAFVGAERNLLAESPEHCRRLRLKHFLLTPRDMERLRRSDDDTIRTIKIDTLFPAGGDGAALTAALEDVFQQAEDAVEAGATLLVLSDMKVDRQRAPIPSLLATAGLHHHLIRAGKRNPVGIVVETGEAREVMHFALLIGYGANAVCPTVAFSTVRKMAEEGLLEGEPRANVAADNYTTAIKKGILKTLSRMGISTIRSYRGAQIFEAIGIGREVIDRYFTNTASRIGGIGMDEIAMEAGRRHRAAFPDDAKPLSPILDAGGIYHVRVGGEHHDWTPEAVYKLQQATWTGNYETFKEYTAIIDRLNERRAAIRTLFRFKKATPIPIEEVEPVENITRRFCTAAMSLGSISRECHETIAIAMNRVGGKSNSGEGGEDPARFTPDENGDSRRSRIKQIASGRFGVTIEYLINADELQIKVAQGAKPGEGGQLPGHKVSDYIGKIRHTTPGVTLISPPPHHDIYSIEDLAQLIYDLKMGNPKARISVKLVSEVGVGTIAAGVAKAKADTVLVVGHDGGTGASPQTSIKHAGLPWELGLAETQQTLVRNRLRDRIRVHVDGQLKTGRDLAIAALMGAEEYGFGTTVLVTQGCILMRKCHLNTCPVGVATQDPALRERYTGKPEYVVHFMRFIAREMREYMAQLGFRTVDEMVGRVDLLEAATDVTHVKARTLDLSKLLEIPTDDPDAPLRQVAEQDHEWSKALDQDLIKQCAPALERGEKVTLDLPIRNVNRTVGATLSGEIVRRHGAEGLPHETITLNFTGSAGQSTGAFLAPGVTMRIEGDANDYLGKGMSGGTIIVTPPAGSEFVPHENIIAGNVILYGATGGSVYIHGVAGERFAIRNSGARAVVEGVGDHGCEYMTGGVVVVLGSTGYNFAAGMSGGVAYVYDENQLFDTRCNLDMVDLETVWQDTDVMELYSMLENHVLYTQSERAKMLLDRWDAHLPLFVKVIPTDYKLVLERMRDVESAEDESVAATEEVYSG